MNNQDDPGQGTPGGQEHERETAGWRDIVRKYQRPSTLLSACQVLDTVGPYALLWALMYFAVAVSYWLVVPLAVLAGAFLVRTFIIFHDCTHGSFFKSGKANDIVGFLTGVLVFTPYHHWRWEHTIHHSSAGDLDRRGMGDIWTLTVEEYLEASSWKRFSYRLARNPFVLFVLAPLFLFTVLHRIPSRDAKDRERRWVFATNLAIAAMAGVLAWIYGLKAYLFIQSVTLLVASTAGVWLFYVQHQFEGVCWERKDDWDFVRAALEGSSFYKLPGILQWFSGSIGFHHIHHLSPRIPNYRLKRAQKAESLFQSVKPLTLRASLKSLTFRLWDEGQRKLVGFKALRAFRSKAGK